MKVSKSKAARTSSAFTFFARTLTWHLLCHCHCYCHFASRKAENPLMWPNPIS